ncbi:MAG: complex I NDUFA9 subunit family protein [Alphaproteobacteria bacterium]|jgi:uncharacterized protein YbjT (DUF2867 family)|nr:complex I NDUFA9 subunit family protein [Alphaproteobacteria bacterium]
MLDLKTITILGGTGFIGRYLVKEIAKTGLKINLVSRNANKSLFLKVAGSVGQINLIEANLLKDIDKLEQIIKNSDVVINLVGSNKIKRKADFNDYYAKLPELIARFCAKYKVKKFIHISSLCTKAISKFSTAKYLGEKLVKEEFPAAIIIRPSLVFGLEDSFFNRIIKLSKILPCFPLPKKNNSLIQPVYVNDLARALTKILFAEQHKSSIYYLVGPDVFNLGELIIMINKKMGRNIKVAYLPKFIFNIAAMIVENINSEIVTRDYLKRLSEDSITKDKQLTFFDMQIQLHNLEEILPNYNGVHKSSCYYNGLLKEKS